MVYAMSGILWLVAAVALGWSGMIVWRRGRAVQAARRHERRVSQDRFVLVRSGSLVGLGLLAACGALETRAIEESWWEYLFQVLAPWRLGAAAGLVLGWVLAGAWWCGGIPRGGLVCGSCGYDLAGVPRGTDEDERAVVCPECGVSNTSTGEVVVRRRPRGPLAVGVLVLLAAGYVGWHTVAVDPFRPASLWPDRALAMWLEDSNPRSRPWAWDELEARSENGNAWFAERALRKLVRDYESGTSLLGVRNDSRHLWLGLEHVKSVDSIVPLETLRGMWIRLSDEIASYYIDREQGASFTNAGPQDMSTFMTLSIVSSAHESIQLNQGFPTSDVALLHNLPAFANETETRLFEIGNKNGWNLSLFNRLIAIRPSESLASSMISITPQSQRNTRLYFFAPRWLGGSNAVRAWALDAMRSNSVVERQIGVKCVLNGVRNYGLDVDEKLFEGLLFQLQPSTDRLAPESHTREDALLALQAAGVDPGRYASRVIEYSQSVPEYVPWVFRLYDDEASGVTLEDLRALTRSEDQNIRLSFVMYWDLSQRLDRGFVVAELSRLANDSDRRVAGLASRALHQMEGGN